MQSLSLLARAARRMQDLTMARRARHDALSVARSHGLVAGLHPTRRSMAGDLAASGSSPPTPGTSRPPRPAAVDVDLLTGREHAVLEQLVMLLTNGEIAAELGVSVNTVKTHLKSVYTKLDVHSRREAVARSRQLGLVPDVA
jgi:DNA-binding CsgD family transcriptional regulator